ncbi:ROK family protein [Eubacteriales bacterium OttesenSCG-928-N13]|nr:ROK family protein [Eubacteriales bacterium OttesenSCG-928-N13]
MLLGALEAGGTKMVASIGDEHGKIIDRASFPTLSPSETMPALIAYFKQHAIEGLGIACFGPLDLNHDSDTYGYITTTPKQGWGNYPILPELCSALGVPTEIDTDVGAAALAEFELGAAKGLGSCLYMTVGTGVGGGVIANGALVHGLVHPEVGHILLKPHPKDPTPNGFCPFHEGCLEGLAMGPSFDKRWGISSKDLPTDHIGWEIEAYYLAQLCEMAIVVLSSECIILGGGVMQQKFLFPMIREQTLKLLNGYVAHDRVLNHIDQMIVEPGLGIHSGVTGALLLGAHAARK